MAKPKVLIPDDKNDIGPWLFIEGVAGLVIAGIGVAAGLLTGDSVWFAVAFLIGFVGFLYVAVTLAASEDKR
jgi:hypothetical protein